jgi:O-antigen/teichoic acid export membrane protein
MFKEGDETSAAVPQTEGLTNPGEHRELRLSASILYAVGGHFGYVLTQMIVLAALAHLRGPKAVGEFGLALALVSPFFMFVAVGQASDVTQKYSFAEYGGVVAVTAILAAVASIAAGLVFASGATLLIVIIVALTKVFESGSKLAYGAFQQAGRVNKVASSLVCRGMIAAALFVALLLLGVPTAVAFLSQLLASSMFALFVDYPNASRLAAGRLVLPRIRAGRTASLARETAALGPANFLGAVVISLPRLVVERYLGLSAVGVLTVVNYLQQAGSVLVQSISQMLVSRFARLHHAHDAHGLRSEIAFVLGLATACSVASMLLVYFTGEWILRTGFGPEFASGHALLVLTALVVCLRLFSIVPQTLLHVDRRFNAFLLRELIALPVCAGLLALLVPRFGLTGAGFAILGAAVCRLLLMTAAILPRLFAGPPKTEDPI